MLVEETPADDGTHPVRVDAQLPRYLRGGDPAVAVLSLRASAQRVIKEHQYLPSDKTVVEEDAEGNPDISGLSAWPSGVVV